MTDLLWEIIQRILVVPDPGQNLKRRARVRLGVVELVGFQLVDSFNRISRKPDQTGGTIQNIQSSPPRVRFASSQNVNFTKSDRVRKFDDSEQSTSASTAIKSTTQHLGSEDMNGKETSGWWIYASSAFGAILALVLGTLYL